MINSKIVFSGGLNADDNERFLTNQEYLNLENFRIGVYGEGKNYRLENIPSTLLKFFYTPAGDNLTIGRAVDYARLWLIWMVANDNGDDAIYAYDIQLDVTYTVLLDSQTESGLNFARDFRIDRNARVQNGLLFYTDNNNEPQCISLLAGIKLNQPSFSTDVDPYATPIPYETLTVIKRPPIYPLDMTKSFDGSFQNNYIQNNAYQFTYYYEYKNYNDSALAPYSALSPYNADGEDSNFVLVQVPFIEEIPDYVQSIFFCVRYGNTGKTFIINQWDKNYYYDRLAIADHNAGTTQLSYSFYDSAFGIALDDIAANTSFDNVALKAKTLEIARNRLYLGNVLKGYDTPPYTTLAASLVNINTGTGSDYTGTWGYVTLHANFIAGGCQDSYMYPFVYSTTAPASFYYFPSARVGTIWNGGVGTVPSSIDFNTSSFGGNTEADLISYLKQFMYPFSPSCTLGTPIWQTPYDISAYNALGNVVMSNFQPVSVNHFFKSSSDYVVNIEFKDRFNRKTGVQRNGVKITIPARTYAQTTFTSGIQWTLSNLDAITQIPEEAYYYQIVIKKNQTTRFFVQIRATGLQYAEKNPTSSDPTPYTYGNTYTFGITYALAIDISALTNYGLGYTFNEGDFARVILSDETVIYKKVLGQDGNFVLLSPTDAGTGSTSTIVLIELFTPYKASESEPYFEVPNVYQISNAGTDTRAFTTLSDIINGDTYAIQRTDTSSALYIVEAMSPNDQVWQIWQTDTGFPNFVDTIGQQQKETNIDYSETYINGTKTNGFNKFLPLNTKDIGSSSGEIQKLQLTNKMQEAGNVMLVIATEETLSAFLQEIQLYTAAQAGDIITTDQVIGTINPLKYTAGTINPESIVEWNGTVWCVDIPKGIAWQYDTNGIVPVSNYKMISFWDKYGKRYIEQGKAVIESLCGFSYIDGCADPSTKEVFFTLPQTEENVVTSGIPVGYAPALPSYSTLPSYTTSIQNRFKIYDGQPKQVVFKYEVNTWGGCNLWLPDCMEYVGNKLYGWKDGSLYLFNESTNSFNVIFGVQYPQRICFPASNEMISAIKDVMDIAIEGIAKPNYSVAFTDYPNEQITDLISDDYTDQEGVQYAKWFMDRLSPQISGTPEAKMYGGDPIKSAVPLIMIEFSEYNDKLVVSFIDIGMNESQGHVQIQPKQK